MHDDSRKLLEEAAREIRHLRSALRDLEVKAEGYSAILMILGLVPRQSQGMAPDLAWVIDRFLADTAKTEPMRHVAD